MSETYIVETSYSFKYTTKDPVPIPDVIDSLKAMERLIKRTPIFLEKRFDTLKITETEVFVERLESGSLDLDFIVRFFCKTDERTERAKAIAKELLEEKGVVRDIVALGVGSLLTIGAFQILSPGTSATPSPTINAYQSVVFQAGRDLGFDEAALKEAIKKVPDQKTLGKDAFNVLKPATQDKKATIEVPISSLNIERDLIDKLPAEYEAPQPSERSTSYKNVEIIIDASDRHNRDKGWAGSVTGVIENRTKIHLDESIDPASLHGRTKIKANIEIIERYVPSKKKYETKEVILEDLIQ
ncbi:hypothetical protein HGO40_23835 [Pseudomonas sp. CG7]|uniref:hypothetical protein n=1 Tax=Pseudomonas sp. CG7 TaxID=191007 RepID=UPI0020345646|nr:hypothetical protein [Pseudomonas sp. CG7]MCM2463463.1 hypothetical protein [Pseudomonas sp. CG7]